ncbi:MAG: glycosyltransferase [Flavobacteriales bacterium]|nr:glycosyltransferase [Flavobacteriales bacterium]
MASDRKELTRKSIQGKIDTWDYQWNAHILMSDGLAVVPEHNLIENIGFENNGTHTNEKPDWICNDVTKEPINFGAIPFVPNREYEMELALAKRLNKPANISSFSYLQKGKSAAKKRKIASINSTDMGGGAEKICSSIHQKLIRLGHDSVLLVSQKKSNESSIVEIEPDWKTQLVSLNPDVIHVHNLHGTSISLKGISEISNQIPVIFTLHDSWLTTGSTNHPFEIQPSLLSFLQFKDWKREILKRKKAVTNSNIRFTTPSQWMRERLFESHGIKAHYIPNGIDQVASCDTEIPSNRFILFVANRPETNPYKDFDTLKKAWAKANKLLGSKGCDLICLGGSSSQTKIGNNSIFILEKKQNQKSGSL